MFLPQAGGLRRVGCARQAGSSNNLGVACSRPSLPRNARGGVSMLAKKRRRRRAGESTPDAPAEPVAAKPEVKPTPKDVGSAPASVGAQAEVEWDGGEEGDDDEEDGGNVGAVVMPPLPSELGLEAVMSAQDLQGEDMMSPAAYQPKPDVADIEMVDGGMGGGAGGMDGAARKKDSKYSFDLAIELPMESESREGGNQSGLGSSTMSPDGVMPLPDLKELAKKTRKKDRQKQATEVEAKNKVERGNIGAFTRLLELDPEADSEEGLFTTESYDAFSSILGEGKPFVGIANSYLQSGHTVLLVLVLLCGFVELPGFPLTSLPYDVREFLKTGLLVVYVINAGISYLSYLEAKRVGQPAGFWAVKGFFLGGLAFNELSQIEPRKTKTTEGGGRQRRG
eukprot:jgi/Undpi1/8859/HiC_scaffold_25.g11321.m1